MRQDSEKEHILKLTLAVYRVSDLFSQEEPLKFQIRESANKILAYLMLNHYENGSRYIREMIGFFDLAEAKNLVDSKNFLVLRREYDRIQKSNLSSELTSLKKPIQERKEQILGILSENGKTRVGDLIKIFPDVNRRTLLRDLAEFAKTGLIIRNGNGRGAYYTHNGQEM